MKVLLDDLHILDWRDVTRCSDCHVHDDSAVLCGWHENVVAAAAAVDALLREQPDLLDGDR